MATGNTVIFEGGDEGDEGGDDSEYMGNDESMGSIGFNPEDFSGDAPKSGGKRYRFEKVDPDKLANDEIRKANLAAKRDLRQRQAEAKTDLARRSQDAQRLAREAQRERAAQAQAQITQIRSDAVSARIQSYSIASFLGLPGYIGATAFDQAVVRPKETQQLEAMKQYQEQLRAYNAQEDERRRSEKRAAEDRIKNLPVTAVDADAIRTKYGIVPPSGIGGPPPPTGPGLGYPAPAGSPIPPGGAGPGGPGGPGNNPPGGRPPGGQPPILPPAMPHTASSISNITTPLSYFAIAATGIRAVNSRIDAAGKDISDTANDLLGDSPQKGIKAAAHTARRLIDPLGLSVPAQVAVTGFDTLLSLTESIKQAAEKDMAFSPLSLTASVEGSIAKLLQSISIAERLDPTKAELIRLQTQLDMAWEELKAELILTLAPLIKTFMSAVVFVLNDLNKFTGNVSGFAEGLSDQLPMWMQIMLAYLKTLVGNTSKDPFAGLDEAKLLKQIADFLDPNKARVIFPNP